MSSIADTVTETIHWVFPEHAGAPGQIHGGRMMQWITQAGTMAAARVAKGTVVLGAMDDIDFLHPVKVGEIAILRARVEYIGTSSLEVGVRVWAESVATGARAVTLNSHLVFVNVDEQVRPRPIGVKIEPRDGRQHPVGKDHAGVPPIRAVAGGAVVLELLLTGMDVFRCGGQRIFVLGAADGDAMLDAGHHPALKAAGRADFAAGGGQR